MIYLDHCATTPMSEEAGQTYIKTSQSFYGNEQSLHDAGDSAGQLLDHCKKELASILNGEASGFYFTSGGSDSNITALLSLAYGNQGRGTHIITSPLEHPSVYQALEKLKSEGFEVEETAVQPNGQISLASIKELIREDTILITICHASSETGVIQPIEEIGSLAQDHGILFHCDAVQTFAKIPIDIKKNRISAISMSAHKVYGPKNTGACYIDPAAAWKSMYPGVVHQQGIKPGTIDVPGIAAFTTASLNLYEKRELVTAAWRQMQSWFLKQLNDDVFSLIGDKKKRLPHHLALRAHRREGQWIMLECNRKNIAISSGSACKTSYSDPPKSLIAMGCSPEEAHGLFRISFGVDTTYEELAAVAETLNELAASSMNVQV
ncbi:IscS subfamily cysteine desulfurase [Alteribacillus bidgolensis]|uniref:Cysteine desulfurase n=1 Tax=Alteribacillus bidgolensis TaxID=930129 RepID=A0A1G8GXH4_9BACI|nr:IscS subfamily cysteine desulfurase [Alteribacillus bidgolensis]SDH99125.1 cysteine desulfurase [Alteribacillus bidgolensis]